MKALYGKMSAQISLNAFTPMSEIAIIEAFADLPDPRRGAGQRHRQALCLALFTLAMPQGGLPVRARRRQQGI